MTPYTLTLLIHIRTSPAKFPLSNTSVYEETINTFKQNKIIKPYTEAETGYQLTNKGIAWLKLILNTPLPKRAYVDSSGKVI